ncbi:hypothetical protein HanPI659440_Chr10g0369531 [Helianthus annuus]|nr:hypothetical protein HanPI659440_Chr10g0369531 [Helianthus annuus]
MLTTHTVIPLPCSFISGDKPDRRSDEFLVGCSDTLKTPLTLTSGGGMAKIKQQNGTAAGSGGRCRLR